MPKGSAELTNARREEIIDACRKLYETMSFKDITLKEIGQQTSFTRTSIYNYFETKEEIFLALFAQQVEQQRGYGVVAEIEVFHVDAALGLTDCTEHIVELFLS